MGTISLLSSQPQNTGTVVSLLQSNFNLKGFILSPFLVPSISSLIILAHVLPQGRNNIFRIVHIQGASFFFAPVNLFGA
jgi:hypothetical protein